MKPRIMYIEDKSSSISGSARIGLVTFSKSGRSIYYQGRRFSSLGGEGFKANFREVESGAEFWISGPHQDGRDRLYPGIVEIDEDIREEYWITIRKMPENSKQSSYRC